MPEDEFSQEDELGLVHYRKRREWDEERRTGPDECETVAGLKAVNLCLAGQLVDALRRVAELEAQVCDKPPPGWVCSRHRGHDGPCAAWVDLRRPPPTSAPGDGVPHP
jgi:hypothetical protein